MSYAVVLSLDIKNGNWEDYDSLYEALEQIGLSRTVVGNNQKEFTLPTTTLYGIFTGESHVAVRDYLSGEISEIYKKLEISGEFFISVAGGQHAWAIRNPKNT